MTPETQWERLWGGSGGDSGGAFGEALRRLGEALEAFGASELILGGFGRLWETLGEALGGFGELWETLLGYSKLLGYSRLLDGHRGGGTWLL